MFRRFFLVGLLSIISPGSLMQLAVATIFCILFLAFQVDAKPFQHDAHNFLARICGSAGNLGGSSHVTDSFTIHRTYA